MTRTPLLVVALAGAFALGCGGGAASTTDAGSGGSVVGSGGNGGSTGGGGGVTASGGRSGGSGGAGSGGRGGGNGGNTTPAMCPPPLACGAGQSCGLDCMGNTGNVTGLAGPAITCTCSNASFICRVMYESTVGSVPPTCPAGSTCSSRCNVCQIPAEGDKKTRTCFCSADLVWVCA